MTFFGVVIIIIVVWYLANRSKKSDSVFTTAKAVEKEPEAKISEETVFSVQARFERKLADEIDFPDGIRYFPVYVYKNVMKVWYKELSGTNRYNDEMTQRLRSDWIDYMNAIEDRETYRYLYMETSDEKESEKTKEYHHKAYLAGQKMTAIEDGFASSIGKDAVEELKRLRGLNDNHSKFDKFGNLAPEGFEFDFRGELKKESK